MPNYCDFTMKIVGDIHDIIPIYNACIAEYHNKPTDPKHFYRVFECIIQEVSSTHMICTGYCAWSVATCFLNGGYHDGTVPNGVCLEMMTDNVAVEIYSTEIGMCFSEHIIVKNNQVTLEESTDYYELDKDYSLEEFNKLTGLDWDQQQFDNYFKNNDYYIYCEHDFDFTI